MADENPFAPFEGPYSGPPIGSEYLARMLLGPPMLGWCMHATLAGLNLGQFLSYMWSAEYKGDSQRRKRFIMVLMALDNIALLFNVLAMLLHVTSQDRTLGALSLSMWMDAAAPVASVSVNVVAQVWLAHRAAKAFAPRTAGRRCFLAAVYLFCAISWLGGLGATVFWVLYLARNYSLWFGTPGASLYGEVVAASIWLFAATLVDWALVAAFFVNRRRQKDELDNSYHGGLQGRVKRAAWYATETYSYVAVLSLVAAITCIRWSPKFAYANVNLAIVYFLPSVYTLAVLYAVNNRDHGLATAAPMEDTGTPRPMAAITFELETEVRIEVDEELPPPPTSSKGYLRRWRTQLPGKDRKPSKGEVTVSPRLMSPRQPSLDEKR